MAKYPPEVWASLWIKNGGLPRKTREAVATVMCESGGDTDAVSSAGARGGWQFMPGTLPSDQCAHDADCSTREAVKLSKRGRDFSAWDCHPDSVARSGTSTGDATYKNILASFDPLDPKDWLQPWAPGESFPGEGAAPGLGDIPPFKEAKDLGAALGQIAAFFVGFGELLLTPDGWLRLGKLLGGSYLVIKGLNIVIKESTGADVTKGAKDGAKKVAETAALIATVK